MPIKCVRYCLLFVNVLVDENMVSLRREPCSITLLIAFLVFLTPPVLNQAKMGSQLC